MSRGRKPSPFLEKVWAAIRVRHYSRRTEKAYLFWIRRFILFHGKRHPAEMREQEVGEFLTHLAVKEQVSASTQNQALNAIVFMYRKVLEEPLGEIHGVVRAKEPVRLPVVLTQDEVARVLGHLSGVHWLVACLQYGSGLRLLESVRLRVKDLDFPTEPSSCEMEKVGSSAVWTFAPSRSNWGTRTCEPRRSTHMSCSAAGGQSRVCSAPCWVASCR